MGWWAACGLPAQRSAILATYHAILQRMVQLGWNGAMDPDTRLPARYIPRPGASSSQQDRASHGIEQHETIRAVPCSAETLVLATTSEGLLAFPLPVCRPSTLQRPGHVSTGVAPSWDAA